MACNGGPLFKGALSSSSAIEMIMGLSESETGILERIQSTRFDSDSPVYAFRLLEIYLIISMPRCSVSALMAPVACAMGWPSALMKYVVGREYTP